MEKICTNENELKKALDESDKYLTKKGIRVYAILGESKRCESAVGLYKNLHSLSDEEFKHFCELFEGLQNELTKEIKARIAKKIEKIDKWLE